MDGLFVQEGKFFKTNKLTEHISSVPSTHAFYSGGLGFMYRSGFWLSSPRSFCGFPQSL